MTERASDSVLFEIIVDRDGVRSSCETAVASARTRARREEVVRQVAPRPIRPPSPLPRPSGRSSNRASKRKHQADSRFPPSLPHHPPLLSFVSRGSSLACRPTPRPRCSPSFLWGSTLLSSRAFLRGPSSSRWSSSPCRFWPSSSTSLTSSYVPFLDLSSLLPRLSRDHLVCREIKGNAP
jgi:hypothetical protein